MSVDAADPRPHTAGFTLLSTAQARDVRDALIAAVEVLAAGHVSSAA
jgi:hypothetical protein